MQRIVFIIILIFSLQGFAQESKKEKIYEFDYFIEYEFISKSKKNYNESVKFFYLTNSEDNSYQVQIGDIGKTKDSFYVHFRDLNTYFSNTRISKDDFYKAETINLECVYIDSTRFMSSNRSTKRSLIYDKLNDTIIDGHKVERYKRTFYNKRIRRRKYNCDYYAMIEPNTSFHLPIFTIAKNYNNWLKNKEIPNGITKELLAINTRSSDTSYVSNLLSYTKYQKKFRISTDCEEEPE